MVTAMSVLKTCLKMQSRCSRERRVLFLAGLVALILTAFRLGSWHPREPLLQNPLRNNRASDNQLTSQIKPTNNPQVGVQNKPSIIPQVDIQKEYHQPLSSSQQFCPSKNFSLALHERVDSNGLVILAMVDEAFIDLAENLYTTSFQPFNITNFLFVGAGKKACEVLSAKSLPCVVYVEDKASSVASAFGGVDFLRKMNIRTYMIIEALGLNYTILHTDLDMVFLQNPLPVLAKTAGDIVAMLDENQHNAGFLLVRPTKYGKKVYKEMDRLSITKPKLNDQQALNQAINSLKKSQTDFKAVKLDSDKFLCGKEYFEDGDRLFPQPCNGCLVVHDNWIVSRDAKVYRLKEHLMWTVDKDQYYSSMDTKYISYNNPMPLQDNEKERELDALKTALTLGKVLDRVVILPRFHCKVNSEKRCPLNSFVKIAAFNEHFDGKYRESSFLQNRLVPIMPTNEKDLIIMTPTLNKHFKKINITKDKLQMFTPTLSKPLKEFNITDDKLQQFSHKDEAVVPDYVILKWFGGRGEAVLRFHSLYDLQIRFKGESNKIWNKKLKEGFKRSDYRQLH